MYYITFKNVQFNICKVSNGVIHHDSNVFISMCTLHGRRHDDPRNKILLYIDQILESG